MRRGLKLTLGIPMVLLGFFVVVGGAAAMVVFGPDGTFQLRSGLDSSGHAIVFDALSLRGLRASGAFKADVTIEVSLDEGDRAFVGIARSSQTPRPTSPRRRWTAWSSSGRSAGCRPSGSRARPVYHEPGPPGERTFWVASAAGDPARLTWTARTGDWSIVVMRADGVQGDPRRRHAQPAGRCVRTDRGRPADRRGAPARWRWCVDRSPPRRPRGAARPHDPTQPSPATRRPRRPGRSRGAPRGRSRRPCTRRRRHRPRSRSARSAHRGRRTRATVVITGVACVISADRQDST